MRGWLVLCVAAACGSPQAQPAQLQQPVQPPPFDPATLDIAPPPDLPAVPAGPACEPFDLRNPACRNDPRMCELGYADCRCPTPPDLALAACWATMPCPVPPDPRVRACRRQFPPCPDPPDDRNPNCPPAVMLGRVIAVDGNRATIGIGTEQGITAAWPAMVLAGDSDEPLADGEIRILRVGRSVTIGEVKVSADTLRANGRVRFTRPAAAHSP